MEELDFYIVGDVAVPNFLQLKVFLGVHDLSSRCLKSCALLIQAPDKDFNSVGLTLLVIALVSPTLQSSPTAAAFSGDCRKDSASDTASSVMDHLRSLHWWC